GRVRVLGLEPASSPREVKALVGYVPESGALYESLTPREYLAVVGRLRGLDSDVVEQRGARFLDALGLDGQRDARMTGFSKGMKQKVVVAAWLLHDPKVLFLDEPLNGLDANTTVTVKEVIRGLSERGTAVFYSSHLMDVVERVSDRVIILDHGKVVADGSAAALRAGTGDATLEALFSRLTGGGEGPDRAAGSLGGLGPAPPGATGTPR